MSAPLVPPALLLDFDGTLTQLEVLPQLAKSIGLESQMKLLTSRAMSGHDNFEESFRFRLSILEAIPLSKIRQIVREIPVRNHLLEIAQNWPGEVAVVTSNLDIWVEEFLRELGLPFFASRAKYETGLALEKILDKAAVVRSFGNSVIFVGDGANDLEAISLADIGVAFNVERPTPQGLREVADFIFHTESDLCLFLQQF